MHPTALIAEIEATRPPEPSVDEMVEEILAEVFGVEEEHEAFNPPRLTYSSRR